MLDEAVEAALRAHDWPGNVRELRNVMERAVMLCRSERLGTAEHGLAPRPPAPVITGAGDGHAAPGNGLAGGTAVAGPPSPLEAVEREHLLRALAQAGWNVTRAARLLAISRDTLRYRIDKHGLQRPPG